MVVLYYPSSMIHSLLTKIGLSDRETSVYLASLELGLQPASIIAKKTNMNRVTTYQTFRKLVEKGLAFTMVRGGVNYFSVEEPKQLETFIMKKQNALEVTKKKLLEKIEGLAERSNIGFSATKVRYYEGIEGIKAVYDDILRSEAPLLMLSPSESLPEELYQYLQYSFYPRLQRNKGSFEMVTSAPKNMLMSLGVYDFMTSRVFLVERLEQDVEVILYGENKAAFLNYVQDPHGVLIEDRFIYNALKFHFQVLKQFYEQRCLPLEE